MVGPTIEEIAALLTQRQAARGNVIETMRQLRDTYNGDVIIPLPEMDKNEKPAVANLITVGLDQTAMRIASTSPSVMYPPLREGIQSSINLASSRTRANLAWWQVNNMNLLDRQRARYFVGYGKAPVILKPETKWGCAKWSLRSPLDTFESEGMEIGQMIPENVIFLYSRSRAWLTKHYPDAGSILKKDTRNSKPSDLIDVAEYNDGEVTVLLAISKTPDNPLSTSVRGQRLAELIRTPNSTGTCLAVVPNRINLDKPMGQFDSQIGMYEMQAKLIALDIIAVERSIFPDTYLIGQNGRTPRFVEGPFDGRTGRVNVVADGVVHVESPTPNMSTGQMADRLERAQRMSGGVPADMTGESASNVRTGKRGDAILAATIDLNIQEAQEIFAISKQEENKIAVAIAKTYFGNERKSFYISSRKFKGNTDYIADTTFENDNNIVSYSYAGADANSLIVALEQRKGAGTMSAETVMEIDPFIQDVEQERDRIIAEQLNQTVLQAFQQQAQSGAIPPADVAAVAVLVASGKKTLAEAIQDVHQQMQARQATQAPANAPEAQPGMAAPGQGAEQPAAPSGPPELATLFSALRGGSNATLQQKNKVSA